jgi:CheY-like chemotaxis protein
LGLSVSYGIVKGHGGKIIVDSALDRGTTFIVELPLAPPRKKGYTDRKRKDSTRLKKKVISGPADPKGPILVVDDEWWVREYLKETLQEAGAEPLTAESGAEAIRIIREKNPWMVFLDLGIPSAPEEKWAQKIRQEFPDVHLVLMSGKVEPLDTIEKSLEEGTYAYLRKPFEVQDVFNILDLDEGEEPADSAEGE